MILVWVVPSRKRNTSGLATNEDEVIQLYWKVWRDFYSRWKKVLTFCLHQAHLTCPSQYHVHVAGVVLYSTLYSYLQANELSHMTKGGWTWFERVPSEGNINTEAPWRLDGSELCIQFVCQRKRISNVGDKRRHHPRVPTAKFAGDFVIAFINEIKEVAFQVTVNWSSGMILA